MQQHRQSGVARQFQLGHVEALLQRAVQARHEVVQPDLADGHEARVIAVAVEVVGQHGEVAVVRAVDEQRVDAERVRQAVPVREFAHGVEVERAHGLQHQHLHAGGLAAGHDGIAVGVELGGVEVAVGVDPGHGVMMPSRVGRPRPLRPWAYCGREVEHANAVAEKPPRGRRQCTSGDGRVRVDIVVTGVETTCEPGATLRSASSAC